MNRVKLSEMADIVMGQSPPGSTCNAEGLGKPLLNGPTEFGAYHPKEVQYTTGGRKFSKKGDILFCVRGSTTGRMNWADKEYVLGRGLASIRFKNGKEYNHFLKYLLEKNLKTILKSTSGSTFPNLTSDILSSFSFLIPEEKQLKLINDFLRRLDAKIDINNRINAELESMAKTLYDYWFVQFDYPDENCKPYKSSGGKMVYNKELKREVPEGWDVKELNSWIAYDKSGDWGKEVLEGNYTEKVNCIRGADINGLKGFGELKSPVRFILEKNLNKKLEANDLVIEISGGSPTQSTGRMVYITKETLERFDNPIVCSNFCKAITLKDERHLYFFANLWEDIYNNSILFGWEGKTSGIKNLLFDPFVNSYKTVVPDISVIEAFNQLAQPIQTKRQKNLIENQHLTQLRDWLLPMLMNGQVKVRDVEDVVAMAAEEKVKYGGSG